MMNFQVTMSLFFLLTNVNNNRKSIQLLFTVYHAKMLDVQPSLMLMKKVTNHMFVQLYIRLCNGVDYLKYAFCNISMLLAG